MSTMNTDEEQRVHQLLAELTHGPVALSGAPERELRRARLLPQLRKQVAQIPAQKAQRRARRQHTTWALAAGFVVLTGVGVGGWLGATNTSEAALLVVQPRGNAVELVDRGQHRTLTEAMSIEASGRLETNESAALTTAEGVLVELSANTHVGLDELTRRAGWRLQLRHGHVACEVPKLTGPKSFSVVTNDAEVIVHGTRFTVTATEASTCVRVTEGRVEVRSKGAHSFLTPGQHWGCEQTVGNVEPPPPQAPLLPAVQPRPETHDTPHVTLRPETKSNNAPPQSSGSTLARETELVGRALTAERRGDAATARGLYAQFLERYPNSPMAPEARRGLTRVSSTD